MYLILIIRETLPTNVYREMGGRQFCVDGSRGVLPSKKLRRLVGCNTYTGQTFVYLQCNLPYEMPKLP